MGPQKRKRRIEKLMQKKKAAFEFLCATFPKCFVPSDSEEAIKPLAIGTGKMILETVQDKLPEGITEFHIKKALHKYCRSPKYQKTISKAGTPRINLQGEEVSQVTEEEVKLREAQIKEAKEKAKAKKKSFKTPRSEISKSFDSNQKPAPATPEPQPKPKTRPTLTLNKKTSFSQKKASLEKWIDLIERVAARSGSHTHAGVKNDRSL